MRSKIRNVQDLDIKKFDDDGTETGGGIRRVFTRRLRKMRIRCPGLSFWFEQTDEKGTEEQ